MNTLTGCVVFAITIGIGVNASGEEALLDYNKTIATELYQFDDLLKSGVEGGELSHIGIAGSVAGRNFAKAKDIIEEAWQFAKLTKLAERNPDLFEQVGSAYLLYNFRTSTHYQRMRDQFVEAVHGKLPDDPVIHYLFGLSYFREAELTGDTELLKKCYVHINKALEIRNAFPEALWIRSQIYAAWRQPGKTRDDLAGVKRYSDKFSPKLFLYDMAIVVMIKRAAGIEAQ